MASLWRNPIKKSSLLLLLRPLVICNEKRTTTTTKNTEVKPFVSTEIRKVNRIFVFVSKWRLVRNLIYYYYYLVSIGNKRPDNNFFFFFFFGMCLLRVWNRGKMHISRGFLLGNIGHSCIASTVWLDIWVNWLVLKMAAAEDQLLLLLVNVSCLQLLFRKQDVWVIIYDFVKWVF